MDPIAVLQNRIEQLEAKLGLTPNAPENIHQHHGDSATANLLHAAQGITNATAGHEKLPEAMHLASELNNYTDPNLAENVSVFLLCVSYHNKFKIVVIAHTSKYRQTKDKNKVQQAISS